MVFGGDKADAIKTEWKREARQGERPGYVEWGVKGWWDSNRKGEKEAEAERERERESGREWERGIYWTRWIEIEKNELNNIENLLRLLKDAKREIAENSSSGVVSVSRLILDNLIRPTIRYPAEWPFSNWSNANDRHQKAVSIDKENLLPK